MSDDIGYDAFVAEQEADRAMGRAEGAERAAMQAGETLEELRITLADKLKMSHANTIEALVEAVGELSADWEKTIRERAEFRERNADALEIAQEMQSQLVSGPELADVERIIAALSGGTEQ